MPIDKQVEDFIVWLAVHCGGGCSLSYALGGYEKTVVDAALTNGLIELVGTDREKYIQLVNLKIVDLALTERQIHNSTHIF